MRVLKRIVPFLLMGLLTACSADFKYSYYSCLKNMNPESSWFNQLAIVEGYGSLNQNGTVSNYVLSFPFYDSNNIFFDRDYVERNTLQVEPGACGREN
jgi:hypothetical protein